VIVLFHRLWGDLAWLPAGAGSWLAVAGAGVAYMLVNTWLVSTWSALRKRTGAWELWLQILRESLAGYVATLLVGAVAARLVVIHPFWVVPLLISVLAIYWGQSRMAGMQRRQITTTLSSLVETNESLSPFMHEHSERVAWWAERLARQVGLPESDIELVWFAAKLHDLGMMLLRRDLEATPDVLSAAQDALIKQHSAIGADVLDRLPGMSRVADYVRSHHEAYDGSGYPDGLRGDRIPLGARILRVAGSYDGLCSARPHRAPFSPEGAIARIGVRAGRDYDPLVVKALEQLITTTDALPSFARVFGTPPPQPALAFAVAAPVGNPIWEAWKARFPERNADGDRDPVARTTVPGPVEAPASTAPRAGATPQVSEAAPYLVAIQETERRRIGRELHDEIGQALTGLKLTLEALPPQPEVRLEESLQNAREVVSDLMTRVHDISLQLRPAVLDDLGLLPALQWHVERYQSQTGVRVAFTHAGLNRRFSTGVETAAYRIAQEALTNVARHAGVPDVRLRVAASEAALTVEVEDRGHGFDASEVESNGLVGMRERALLVGGRLAVETGPGTGTRITAMLPITTAEVPRQAR
jgi:putative nucleotidyltransferase with HDIG domain